MSINMGLPPNNMKQGTEYSDFDVDNHFHQITGKRWKENIYFFELSGYLTELLMFMDTIYGV